MILKCKKNLEIHIATSKFSKYFHAWWNDGNLMKSVGFPNGLNNSFDDIVEKLNFMESSDNKKLYIIKNLDSQNYIGELSYSHLSIESKSCQVGIKICEIELQSKGFGYEAFTGFLDYLNKEYGITEFKLDVLATNHNAIGLYEKIGFKKVKYNENSWTNVEGMSFDSIEYQYTM